jgi:hypothetical protein
MYEPRVYRHWVTSEDLVSFNVTVKETDLHIRAATNLRSKAYKLALKYRAALEKYIAQHPPFLSSLVPLPFDENAPLIVQAMARAAERAGVGPMAAVAGAIAEFIGNELLAFSPEVIIENGGDIYLKSLRPRVIGIYAGTSPLTGKIGLQIAAEDTPLGVCTSSGTVGHSLSFGKADAVTTLAKSATLADAAATAIANTIEQPADIPGGIALAQKIDGLAGVLIIKDAEMGIWGDLRICATSANVS